MGETHRDERTMMSHLLCAVLSILRTPKLHNSLSLSLSLSWALYWVPSSRLSVASTEIEAEKSWDERTLLVLFFWQLCLFFQWKWKPRSSFARFSEASPPTLPHSCREVLCHKWGGRLLFSPFFSFVFCGPHLFFVGVTICAHLPANCLFFAAVVRVFSCCSGGC